MTYGESLTYWYLRLNGFFPISRFVLHQPKGHGQSMDCDLLGVRLPHTCERIGNEYVKWDETFFKGHNIDLTKQTMGIITEVKTGRYTVEAVKGQFTDFRLKYAIGRLGLFPQQEIDGVVEQLATKPTAEHAGVLIVKLLVDSHKYRPEGSQATEWLRIAAEDVEEFITDRMYTFAKHKSGSWFYFEGDLIQSFAWKAEAFMPNE